MIYVAYLQAWRAPLYYGYKYKTFTYILTYIMYIYLYNIWNIDIYNIQCVHINIYTYDIYIYIWCNTIYTHYIIIYIYIHIYIYYIYIHYIYIYVAKKWEDDNIQEWGVNPTILWWHVWDDSWGKELDIWILEGKLFPQHLLNDHLGVISKKYNYPW
jgi:hypothetical protein